MIVQRFTLFEDLSEPWPLLVLISLERKDDPCKSDFTHFEQTRDTLFLLVFISLEKKDNPCKSDTSTFYP